MFFRKRLVMLALCSSLFLAGSLLLLSVSGSSRAESKKYGKCHAKCVQKLGVCLENAAEHGDRDERIEEKAKCERKKDECVEKCED